MEVHRYTKNDAGGHKVPLGGRMRNRLRLATPGKGKDTGTVNMDKKVSKSAHKSRHDANFVSDVWRISWHHDDAGICFV